MVTRAAARGRITSAKIVQASQVFSQAHLRAYFMGIVKLAFVTPAMIRVAIPHAVLLMNYILPFSFSRDRCATYLDHANSSAGVFKVAPKRFEQHGRMIIGTGFYHVA